MFVFLFCRVDASETAAGARVAYISYILGLKLYDLCEGPSKHVFLKLPHIITAEELVKCSVTASLITSLF